MRKLVIATTLFSAMAFAGNPNTGCGLGSMVFPEQDSLVKQVLATTTNGISGNQTFGITTGTLGCEKPAKIASNDKLNNFVRDNLDKIALDASKGQGETIKTLAKLMNVSDEKSFATNLQNNFDKIFATNDVTYSEVIDNIAKYAI